MRPRRRDHGSAVRSRSGSRSQSGYGDDVQLGVVGDRVLSTMQCSRRKKLQRMKDEAQIDPKTGVRYKGARFSRPIYGF